MLLPGHAESEKYKSYKTMLLERHDLLGIIFYRRSFSGLSKPRRVAYLIMNLILSLGVNVFVFAAIDGSCYKIDHCYDACVRTHGEEVCAYQDISVSVVDLAGTRETEYSRLFLYPQPDADAPERAVEDYTFCSDVQSPVWDYSPVCARLCQTVMPKIFLQDNSLVWNVSNLAENDSSTSISCDPRTGELEVNKTSTQINEELVVNGRPDVLACESLVTRAKVLKIGVERDDEDQDPDTRGVQKCDEFTARGGVPSPIVVVGKGSSVALFTLIADHTVKYFLRLSQPFSFQSKILDRFKAARQTVSIVAAFVYTFFVALGVGLFVLGGFFIGDVSVLWGWWGLGVVTSLAIKYIVFSPATIGAMWVAVRCGAWRCFRSDQRARAFARTYTEAMVASAAADAGVKGEKRGRAATDAGVVATSPRSDGAAAGAGRPSRPQQHPAALREKSLSFDTLSLNSSGKRRYQHSPASTVTPRGTPPTSLKLREEDLPSAPPDTPRASLDRHGRASAQRAASRPRTLKRGAVLSPRVDSGDVELTSSGGREYGEVPAHLAQHMRPKSGRSGDSSPSSGGDERHRRRPGGHGHGGHSAGHDRPDDLGARKAATLKAVEREYEKQTLGAPGLRTVALVVLVGILAISLVINRHHLLACPVASEFALGQSLAYLGIVVSIVGSCLVCACMPGSRAQSRRRRKRHVCSKICRYTIGLVMTLGVCAVAIALSVVYAIVYSSCSLVDDYS